MTLGAFTSRPWSIINWAHSTDPLLHALCNPVSLRLFRAVTLAPALIRVNAHLMIVLFSYPNPCGISELSNRQKISINKLT